MSGYFPPANAPEGTTWTHPSGRVFLLRGGYWVDAPAAPQAFTPPPSTPLIWNPETGTATHGSPQGGDAARPPAGSTPAPQVPVSTPAPPSTPIVVGPNGATHGNPSTAPATPAKQSGAYGGWRPMGDAERDLYTFDDPQAAFRQFVGDLGGGTDNKSKYVLSKFQDAWANYLRLNETDANLMFPDSLTRDYWGQLSNQFQGMGFDQRGETAPVLGTRGNSRIVW